MIDLDTKNENEGLIGTSLRSSGIEMPGELMAASHSSTSNLESIGSIGSSLAASASAVLSSVNAGLGHYSNLMVSDANMLDTSLRYIPESSDSERFLFCFL